jgi:radical SAM superfamily enzyme YgiQ (UPF0313 family)
MDTPHRRYSLLLINPKRKLRYLWDFHELCEVMGKKTPVPPLSLPTVAALTPPQYDIRIIDEDVEEIDFALQPDIVGITALGNTVKRGYEIADRFRRMGVTVVMGGPQVSFNVETSLEHADAIVIGEAEGAWQECLGDFERGTMRPTYKSATSCDYKSSPVPRWDLMKTDTIMAMPVQVSRGCPYRCEFCIVGNMLGARHRYREIDNVIAEIKALPKRQLTFADDNLTADKKYAHELMERLRPLKISWMCQASLDLCEDEALLAKMAQAGCTSILIGIESLDAASLQEAGKHQNKIEKFERGIKTIHDHGIHVIGSFIVGFDSDRLDAFDKIFAFTVKNAITMVTLNVLTAYPGSRLYERMKRDGRLNAVDTDMLGIYPTMRYKNISQTEMFRTFFATLEKMYSYEVVLKKAEKTLGNGHFTHYNEADISVMEKLRSIVYLLRNYLFTNNPAQKDLSRMLFRLMRQKRVSIGNIIEYLLLIASFNGYLQATATHRTEILKEIQKVDPGPMVG